MLSIGKLVVGQQRYYDQQVAQGRDDYYSGRGEAPGEWVGAGARALGLSGVVSADQFNALIGGLDPRDPSKALRDGPEPKVAALDLTFSAPKSVSVLFAVADEDVAGELVAAHEAAVRAAVGWLEDTAVQVRRGAEGRVRQPGEGLIAAGYRHRMSRALDPQLHTHVVAANLARGPDGRFTALFGAPLYQAAKTAGYLYQAHLRAEISERLGLEWGPVQKGAAELKDIPPEVLSEFSRRRHEMERAAAEGGFSLRSKRSAEAAAVDTRDRKQYGIETHTWREEIQARAGEHGLDRQEVARLVAGGRERLARGNSPNGGGAAANRIGERELEQLAKHLEGAHGLTERSNTFDDRAVLREFAQAAKQGARIETVRDRAGWFGARDGVLRASGREMTTRDLVETERRLIAAAVERVGEGRGVLDERIIERALASADRPPTDEQRDVVRACATSGHGVQAVEALAGTGKTYTAGVLRAMYEDAGHTVIGLAPTGRGARELSDEAGIPAMTVDRALVQIEQLGAAVPRGSVIILDEAGTAPTRATAKLLELAAAAEAKVIAIGDSGQLPSVLAGGWLRAVGERVGTLRLTEVMRQRDPGERRALAALHDGAPERYVDWALSCDRVEIAAPDELNERAVARWREAAAEHGPAQAVIISRGNERRESLNAAARAHRAEAGELGAERSYGGLTLAIGDRVICRNNDARVGVDNGTRGTVRHLDRDQVVIDTDSGLVRELPAGYVSAHVELAYCLTGHGMQGGTVEHAIVVASPDDLTAGWSYTALSRARGETLLLLGERPLDKRRRDDLAPGERLPAADRGELLARVVRRMRQRDDEELAMEQLLPAGREDDRELAEERAVVHERPQERGAARVEEQQPQVTRSRLMDLRDELGRLSAGLSVLPSRALRRFDELEAEEQAKAAQRAEHAEHLTTLRPPVRRLGRVHDPDAEERAFLAAALDLDDRRLSELRTERDRLQRELGAPDQVRSERDGLDRAIGDLRRDCEETLAVLVEREVERQPDWLKDALGPRPSDVGRDRDVWQRAGEELARYRLEHDVIDQEHPLGPEPPIDDHQHRAWSATRGALERAQRQLGVEMQGRDQGLDLGLG
jgi:conjugative relaxase-like TrwC/TraI family protein